MAGHRWAVACAVLVGCAGDPKPEASRPVTLPADEVVRRLSELIFRAPPDVGQRVPDLSHSAGVAALARTMLRDPRAARGIDAFVKYWLDLDDLPSASKDARLHPGWNAELGADMVAEVRRFVGHVVLEGDGRLPTLLTLPLAFANERLAAVYGFPDVRGAELRPITHDGRVRTGILGLPGVIASRSREARTYPSRRGHYVAYRFACRPVFNSNITDPMVEDRTMRDLQDWATSYVGCQGCHHLMNPPGWTFEHFDAIGGYRDKDVGIPVDSTGRLPPDLLDTPSEVPVNGLPDLARAVAGSARASSCHALFWLTFAVPALAPEGPLAAAQQMAQVPGLAEIAAEFRASGQDVRALIAAVASSPQFLAP